MSVCLFRCLCVHEGLNLTYLAASQIFVFVKKTLNSHFCMDRENCTYSTLLRPWEYVFVLDQFSQRPLLSCYILMVWMATDTSLFLVNVSPNCAVAALSLFSDGIYLHSCIYVSLIIWCVCSLIWIHFLLIFPDFKNKTFRGFFYSFWAAI